MAVNDENDYQSDDDVNPIQHSQFIQDVFQLDKKQYVKKPTRTEPTTQVSEFNLVKTSSNRTSTVNIADLAKALDNKKKHVAVSNKIKSSQKKVKTLRQPLEKPQRDRIKRTIGFTEVQLDLGKWDAIVTKNRVSSQLQFPLHEGDMEIHKDSKLPFQLKMKSKLDIELEKLEPVIEKEEPIVDTFPLTMKEILERRREMARLRAHQSYQEAKYHRQNKIKSKKFHRIQRKDKIKTQIKDFEKLQKTDPEEALRKLEELDKTRAEERMTLRHRSTGQWAKNKQVRAKYDKESRQVLAQQLSISRDLTQKLKVDSSSESENEDKQITKLSDQSNPWIGGIKTGEEINDFVSGYRKFWEEKNKTKENEGSDKEDVKITEEISDVKNDNKRKIVEKTDKIKTKKIKVDEKKLQEKLDNLDLSSLLGQKLTKLNTKKTKKTPKSKSKVKCTSEWEIESISEEIQEEETVEEIFEDLKEITQVKLNKKINKLKDDLLSITKVKKIKKTKEPKNKLKNKLKKNAKTTNYMELPREKMRPEIDDELYMENYQIDRELSKNSYLLTHETQTAKPVSTNGTNIDPDKFLSVKPIHLDTFLPDNVVIGDDNEESENEDAQKAFITEAFAGDDVVADFRKEKKNIVQKDQPQNVDLSLPGWGSWGGKNIKQTRRKNRRFIIKFPKHMPRRDDNKGQLIINETKNEKMQHHLVTEVPFPFRSVKDYEASLRAPIGDTFVPQTAFRRLIKPSIITKKGEIIEPMDDQVLVRNKFTKTGMVVKRRK